MKKIIFMLLITFLFIIDKAISGCPHCYQVAKIKLIYSNSNERIGYMPIYYGMRIRPRSKDSREWTVKKGEDILKLIRPPKNEIEFFESYINLDKIGNIVDSLDYSRMNIEKLNSIIFLNWENFHGASYVPVYDHLQIEKLKTQKIYDVEKIDGSVSVYTYVNLNSSISSQEFKLFLKYFGGERSFKDEYSSLKYLHRFLKSNESRHKVVTVTNFILEELDYCIEVAQERVEELDYPFSNPYISSLLNNISVIYKRRLGVYKGLKNFLLTDNIDPLVSFINNEQYDQNKKRSLLYNIIRLKENENHVNNLEFLIYSSGQQFLNIRNRINITEKLNDLNISLIVHYFD